MTLERIGDRIGVAVDASCLEGHLANEIARRVDGRLGAQDDEMDWIGEWRGRRG